MNPTISNSQNCPKYQQYAILSVIV